LIELVYTNHYLYFALWLGIITAFLTSFYSFRLIYFSFLMNPSLPKKNYKSVHEGKWNLFSPLLILFIFSICVGYFSLNYVLITFNPPILNTLPKSYPLIVTLLGISLSIILYYFLINFWGLFFSRLLFKVYNFVVKVWYWDPIKGNYLALNLLNVGFLYTYKLIDNQFIEKLGPSGGLKIVSGNSSRFSMYYSGKISSYILALIFFIYVLYTHILLILEN
jgi:NADH:ubiquinone oxidoreductase subunit 5 (subunit L)/multisubunit Na+/H+ antiporter MnhA subunit